MSDSPAQSVTAVLAQFRDITCLRRGPEDLPVSWFLLLTTIILQIVVAMLIGGVLPPVPPKPGVADHSVALMAIDVLVPLAWGAAVLFMVGRPERFLQMMTAMFGSQLVMMPLLIPAMWAASYFSNESTWLAVGKALYLALSVWLVVVQARILRAATDWPMFASVMAVIMQSLLALMILFAMFPDLVESVKQGS